MKGVKIVAAALGAVLVLLVAGAALLAWTFDPNDYKDHLASWVEGRTGRELNIEEDLELAFFPWLAVETGGLTLGNAPGFGDRPFATVRRAAVRVKLMPLLTARQVELGTIQLEGVELNLARDAAARGNWEDLLRSGETDPQGAQPQDGGWAEDLQIEGLRLRNATVSWREDVDDLRYVVSGRLETGAFTPGEPVAVELAIEARDVAARTTLRLDGGLMAGYGDDGSVSVRELDLDFAYDEQASERRAEGRLQTRQVSYDGNSAAQLGESTLELRAAGFAAHGRPLEGSMRLASASFDLEAQTLAIERLTTETGGIRAAWALRGERVLDAPSVTGSVQIADAPLAELLELLSVEPPSGVAPAALGGLELSAAFRYEHAPVRATLEDVEARLLGMHVTGQGALSDDRVRGRLAVAEFRPGEAWLAVVGAHLPEDVDLGAAGPLSLSARFESDLSGERVSLRDVRAGLLGATLTGEIDVSPSGAGTLYSGSFATSRFAPDAFAATFAKLLPRALTPEQLGTLSIGTRFGYDTRRDSLLLESLDLHAFGMSATGRIAGRAVSTAAVWTGEARVARFSPRDLLQRFGEPPPDTSDARVLTRADVAARFEVTAERGRFDDIVLALDDSRITGNFTVEGFDDPGYVFALAIDGVDADRYLPPRGDEAQPGEARAGDMELPAESLNALRLQGSVEIGDLALAGMRFSEVATDIRWGGGSARLDRARAKLYGGAFEGSFAVDTNGREPSMTLAGKATSLALTPIIEALTGDANVSGTGDFDLNLTGHGATVIENVRTAGGTAGFTLRDGVISGFNLGRGLCAAYNLVQRTPAPPAQPDETPYQLIQGTARVTDGIANSQDLLAVSSFMQVRGGGRLVLAEQHMDYQLEAKLTGSIGIRNCEGMDGLIGESIPLKLRGPVTEPEISPDYSEIIERRLRRELERRVTDRLQDLLRSR